ncbi:MAG: hypothetical protein EKK41_11495 [Hyphomicrobiales bacterium]|nr:MAG: hypothetical protein EKK41_11495 [Hyphomicrobiales bacterium]
MLLVSALLLVLVPAGALIFGASSASARVAAHPADAAVAGLGVLVFLALFGLPLHRLVRTLGLRRTVTLDAHQVSVAQSTLFNAQAWSLALSEFEGVAHVVRTSLSGARHELVLVHPERGRHVLLLTADTMSEGDVARVGHLLRLPVLPAERVLLPRRAASPRAVPEPIVAEPLAQAA